MNDEQKEQIYQYCLQFQDLNWDHLAARIRGAYGYQVTAREVSDIFFDKSF